jgi:hypothetical protein
LSGFVIDETFSGRHGGPSGRISALAAVARLKPDRRDDDQSGFRIGWP